jgi:two-component system LytT family response regulator
MAIKALIVDDELNNRENLKSLLAEYCKEVEVIGMADSVDSAFRIIKSNKPDLLFLDIKMPKKNGFALLEQLGDIDFEVIIVTAYNQYAIQAIKFCAIDYLLKPIDVAELSKAVEHVSRRLNQKQENERLKQLILHFNNQGLSPKIGLASHHKVDFVEVARIVRCEADNNYTHVFLDPPEKKTISKTLKEFEDLLKEQGFIRVHQSHLVNPSHITSLQKSDGGYLRMSNGSIIPISRARKNEIIALIRQQHSM